MSRILVSGAAGFIGRNLVRVLQGAGRAEVVAIRRDVDFLSSESVQRAFADAGPVDYIIHAADKGGDARWSESHAATQFITNSLITVHALDAWRRVCPEARFVGLGSVWAYPADVSEVVEEKYWDGRMHPPTEHYGLTKKLLGVGIEAMRKEHGMRGVMLVLGAVYGSGDTSTRVIPSLIKRMRSRPETLEVWGSPDGTRDFVHIDDQIEGILRHLDYDGGLLNVSTGLSTTLQELVSTLVRILDYRGNVVFASGKNQGVVQRLIRVDKARAATGWPDNYRLHTLEEGLRKTIANE